MATATACFGSQASSPTSSTSFSPMTPPAALMSATAFSAPWLHCSPNAANWPVIGPAMATVMSASAEPALSVAREADGYAGQKIISSFTISLS